MVKINKRVKLHNINDVFIFSKNCQQVYYTYTYSFRNDHNRVDWLFVVKTKPRIRVLVVEYDNDEVIEGDNVFQKD